MKNSDTFLPAPVKIAVNSVLHITLCLASVAIRCRRILKEVSAPSYCAIRNLSPISCLQFLHVPLYLVVVDFGVNLGRRDMFVPHFDTVSKQDFIGRGLVF